MKFLEGYVKLVLFNNKDTGYTICKIKVTESSDELDDNGYFTVTGYFPILTVNELYRFFGDFTTHKKYGLQFAAKKYETKISDSREGLIKYLSSEVFFGVGPKLAAKIVDQLGDNCIDKIIENENVLREIGINEVKVKTIHRALIQNQGIQKVLISLYDYKFSARLSMKIYNYYQGDTLRVVKENPYQLIDDIDEISFKRADELAMEIGFKLNNLYRMNALGKAILQTAQYGDTYLYLDEYIDVFMDDVNRYEPLISSDEVHNVVSDLVSRNILHIESDKIMLYTVYEAETEIASDLVRFSPPILKLDTLSSTEFSYTEEQLNAIKETLTSSVTVITGGPGTGKTTVIKGIINNYKKLKRNSKISLVAPTGRAAKRMEQTTGIEARTIHSYLGYDFNGIFTYDRFDQLSPDLLIIDESSMIDIFLANQLFQAITTSTRIVIVGDNDQLPSVGPGQVLKDIIDSDVVTVVRLSQIFRQSEGSNIIGLAHNVNNGELPILDSADDILYVSCTDDEITDNVSRLYNEALDEYSLDDIQVLAPMYKGKAGIDSHNLKLQEIVNPNPKLKTIYRGTEYRDNDRVMQLVNQPTDGIMNGDIGIFNLINKKTFVTYENNVVEYDRQDLENITHAYCISIHKSQGSEYKLVILPMSLSYKIMLKRKLLYTAITRAKVKLVLVGDMRALSYAIQRLERKRRTLLKTRLENMI